MDRASALQVLGLEGNPGEAEIQAAAVTRRDEIAAKRVQAPTDALRSKFESLEQRITEAEQMLLSGASASAPRAPSPLSQTKLADLPQGQQSYTGFDGGAAGAQIHLRNGQLLANRYEIKEQIGAGGMGAVYHAFDRTKQEDIALKVLLPALLQNERARQRFLDEARISARLSHPNIVNVHDVQQDGDFFFLTMELLHGQDLRQLMEARQLSRQSFDEEEARTLAQTLAAALAYAHQHTVHRDIKPENIWVTEDGDYKIMDFGIARVQSTSQRTQTGAAMGTAYYMAPEQLKGTSTIDGRADQYALGVLLYELLSGDVPAGRFKPLRELRKDIGKGFAAAVEKALETRAEDRFADMKAFADALQAKTGPGINLPELPWKGIGIAAALLLAVIGVGAVVSGGGIDLGSLLPMSAEQKAQREGQLAKLQGEIKVLKQRLETARRDLASDVKEAERNKSKDLKTLQHWQTLTENSIFNGSKIGELEGTLSMAETLLRKEQYAPSEQAFTEVKTGYEALNEAFRAGEKLYAADVAAQKAKADWQADKQKYGFSGKSPGAEQAQQQFNDARQSSRSGELLVALLHYQQAAENWEVVKRAPGKLVSIPGRNFRMQEHEVTWSQYQPCIDAGACPNVGDEGWGKADRPVIRVSWNDVQEYIKWLNRQTGQTFRLPTEAEWEYAARAGSTTEYSWGDSIGRNRANCDGCGSRWDKSMTAPVKSFSPNAYGLYDMHGNVWEWTQSCWKEDCGQRVRRGGSWATHPVDVRSELRGWNSVSGRYNYCGFRLVQDR